MVYTPGFFFGYPYNARVFRAGFLPPKLNVCNEKTAGRLTTGCRVVDVRFVLVHAVEFLVAAHLAVVRALVLALGVIVGIAP